MVILNAIILRTAIRQHQRIANVEHALHNANGVSESREEAARKMKACKVIICVVTAFIICHTPIGVMHLCLAVSDSFVLNSALNEISFVLYLISSAVNPLIYCRVDRVFRECAWRMLSSVVNRFFWRGEQPDFKWWGKPHLEDIIEETCSCYVLTFLYEFHSIASENATAPSHCETTEDGVINELI